MFCCASKKKTPSSKYQEESQPLFPVKGIQSDGQDHMSRQQNPKGTLETPIKDQIVPIMNSGSKNVIPDEIAHDNDSIGISKQKYQKLTKFQALPQ
jgi:hypothetical protein